MYRDYITLQQALLLEESGSITIVDTSLKLLPPLEGIGEIWKNNFTQLQSKHRHISPDKLLTFLNTRYIIEVEEDIEDGDTGTRSWRYLHGIENAEIKSKILDEVEYVYVMVNPGYPHLVKIGMTIHDVPSRATSINATATVEEWVPKFALPLSKGSAYKVEQSVHKFFSPLRVSSDLGGSREFFTLSPFTAIDKIREVGAPFTVGEPILY